MKGRVLALAALLASVTPAAITETDLARNSLEFDQHWDRFLREEFGCPSRGYFEGADCHKARGFVDYKEWRKARALAKRLFDLADK